MHFVAEFRHRFVGIVACLHERVDDHLHFAAVHGPLDFRKVLAGIYERNGQDVKVVFLCHTEYAVLEFEHAPVGAAVPFGEYREVVAVCNAVGNSVSHACVLSRVLVYGNAANVVYDPSENRGLPEASLRHERGVRDRVPNDVRVHETLVVRDNHEALFLRDVLGAFDGHLDAEKFKDDILEMEPADVGDFFFVVGNLLVKNVGRSKDNHPGEDHDVIEEC